MTSEEYIEESPTVSVESAICEVQRHGQSARIDAAKLSLLLIEEGFEPCKVAVRNGRVDTQAIFNWLGY